MERKLWLGAIVVAAALLRGGLLLYLSDTPVEFYSFDSAGYETLALNLLNEGRFSMEVDPPFRHILWRTPGYPAFIALVYAALGRDPVMLVLVQVLIGCLGVWLLFLLAKALWLSERAAVLAAGLLAVEPVSVLMTNRILTETVFTTVLMGALWCLARYWQSGSRCWLAASAPALAMAALIRPISQFLPIALIPAFLAACRQRPWPRWRLACGAWLLLSLSLTSAWAFHNWKISGCWTLSSIGDLNLYYYRARAVLAEVEGISNQEARLRLEQHINDKVQQEGLSEAETYALIRRSAMDLFVRHPLQTLRMTIKGAARIMLDPGYSLVCTILDRNDSSFECFPGFATMDEAGAAKRSLNRFMGMNPLQKAVLVWSAVLLTLMCVAGAAGLLRLLRRRQWPAFLLLATVIAYFVVLAAGAEATSRFRVPIIPFLALAAAVFLQARMDGMNETIPRRPDRPARPDQLRI